MFPLIMRFNIFSKLSFGDKNILVSLEKRREKSQEFVALAAGYRSMTREHFCLSTLQNLNNSNFNKAVNFWLLIVLKSSFTKFADAHQYFKMF